MRKLRQFSIAAMLALVFATSTFAGIIGTGPAPDPGPTPPPPSASASGITDTPPSDQQTSVGASDPIIDVTLHLIQSVLSVF